MSCNVCIQRSLNLAEIICNNLLPLCNRESLVYDLRTDVPGTFTQIIEVLNLFKCVNVIDIRTKWFGKFRRFELSTVNLTHGSQNWFEVAGVPRNRGFQKSGVKLQSLSEANPRETRFGSRYREVRETEGSRNRDSTVDVNDCWKAKFSHFCSL